MRLNLDFAIQQLKNSVNQESNSTTFKLGQDKAAHGER